MQIQQRNIEDIQDDHCKLIKNILLTPPTYVEKLPFKVTNYSKPIEMWNNYKIKQQLDRMEDRLDIILDVVEE